MATFDLTKLPYHHLCEKCEGWCCKNMFIPVSYVDPDVYEARGIPMCRRETGDEVWVEQTCQHLTETGCGIYKERPLTCILFPWEDHPIIREHCEVMRKMFPNREDGSSVDGGEKDPQ